MKLTRVNKRGIAVLSNTVKINAKGVARLSPDLVIAKRFRWSVFYGVRNRRLVLDLIPDKQGDLNIWFSSPKATSGLISLAGALNCLVVPANREGMYKAVVGHFGWGCQSIRIHLKFKLDEFQDR